MAKRGVSYYLIKAERFSGWLLLPILLTYLCTGYAYCGKLGADRLVEPELAHAIYKAMDRPLVVVFVVHVLTAAYFSFRRWGWIGRRRRSV